jgi:hypothetical protein
MVRLLRRRGIVQIHNILHLAGKSEKDTKGRRRKTPPQPERRSIVSSVYPKLHQ